MLTYGYFRGWSSGLLVWLLGCLSCLAQVPPHQETQAFSPKTGLQRLGPRSWALVAGDENSCNGAFFVGREAVLAVDPGLTPALARKFLRAIGSVTTKPVKTVILTHWHPDHALGIVCLKQRHFSLACSPATRVALLKNLPAARAAVAGRIPDREARRQLLECRFQLPEHLIQKREVFDLGEHKLVVWAPGPGHTLGDLVVWSPSERVLVAGDLFLNHACPDMEGGSIPGLLQDLDQLLKLPVLKVVPGHFQVGTQKDLRLMRDYVQAVLRRAAALRQQGFTQKSVFPPVSFPRFTGFRQFKKFRATFEDNVRAALRQLEGSQPGQRTSASHPSDMKEHCKQEVLELHHFFQEWFRGTLPKTAAGLARFAGVLDPRFEIVFPSGVTMAHGPLVQQIREAHASRRDLDPPFSIQILKLKARALSPEIVLVSYEEWAHAQGHWAGRASTALFREQPGTPQGVTWLHVQETPLPEEKHP